MDLLQRKCVPCEGGVPPLSDTEEDALLDQVPKWKLLRQNPHKLTREFTHENFVKALEFVNKVGELAETEGHHPDIHIFYNRVKLELYTHAIGGLSENDFILAAKVNEIKV